MKSTFLFLVAAVGLSTGCAADAVSDEDVGVSEDGVRASVATGDFKLYETPGARPSVGCDVHTSLKLNNAPLGVATFEERVEGECEIFIAPNRREYRLHNAGTSCGSQIYRGRVRNGAGYSTVKITDHRTRTCRDVVPAKVIVEESMPGFPGRITVTLYSLDSAPPTATSQWLTISPRQCGTNPWEMASLPGTSLLGGEAGQVDTFFRSEGLELQEVSFLYATEPRIVCLACSCPRGDVLVVKAKDSADADALKSRFRFREATDLYTRGTVQCGGNPWEGRGIAGATEADKLATWLTSQGADASDVGFANRTHPIAVCLSCSCPRGDRALAIAASPSEGADLVAAGFSPLR